MTAGDGNGGLTLEQLQAQVRRFQRARHWHRSHNPKDLAMSVAIEAAELMEHFQWGDHEQAEAYMTDAAQRGEVAAEMADVLIYLLVLADHCGIELTQAVTSKMALNETRFPVPEDAP